MNLKNITQHHIVALCNALYFENVQPYHWVQYTENEKIENLQKKSELEQKRKLFIRLQKLLVTPKNKKFSVKINDTEAYIIYTTCLNAPFNLFLQKFINEIDVFI